MTTTITKRQAAVRMLEQALNLFLDERDFTSAIVLAGSAEDVFHAHLVREGVEPARENFARVASRLSGQLSPKSAAVPEKAIVTRMRDPFNWLRHADNPADSETATWDLEEEAVDLLERAIENMRLLLGSYPARIDEFTALIQRRNAR